MAKVRDRPMRAVLQNPDDNQTNPHQRNDDRPQRKRVIRFEMAATDAALLGYVLVRCSSCFCLDWHCRIPFPFISKGSLNRLSKGNDDDNLDRNSGSEAFRKAPSITK